MAKEVHVYKFNIEADSAEQARKIAEALNTFYKKVDTSDLLKLAEAVNKDPKLVKTALKFI